MPLTMSAEREAEIRKFPGAGRTGDWVSLLLKELDAERDVHAETEARRQESFAHFEDVTKQLAATREQIDWVRRQLWLGHGHIGLYGDDGEMQCNLGGRMLDFKRAPIEDIVAKILDQFGATREKLAALQPVTEFERLLRECAKDLVASNNEVWRECDELRSQLTATRDLALELVKALEHICRLGHSKLCRAHFADVPCDCGYSDGCRLTIKVRAQLGSEVGE